MIFKNKMLTKATQKGKRYLILIVIGLFQILPIPSADAARIVKVGLYNNKPYTISEVGSAVKTILTT